MYITNETKWHPQSTWPATVRKLFWALLNYNCPHKCVCYFLHGFICDFLEFPMVKSSKIFTAHRTVWDTHFKHKKEGFVKAVFFIFANLCLLPRQKNWSYRFCWKTNRKTIVSHLKIASNFIGMNQKKVKGNIMRGVGKGSAYSATKLSCSNSLLLVVSDSCWL